MFATVTPLCDIIVLNIQLTEEPSFPINKITGVQQMTHIKLFQLPSDFVQTSKLAISVK